MKRLNQAVVKGGGEGGSICEYTRGGERRALYVSILTQSPVSATPMNLLSATQASCFIIKSSFFNGKSGILQ